jgi:hypothetical protein
MRRRLLVLFFVLLGLLLGVGCARCGRDQSVAKLEQKQGDVRRSGVASANTWKPTTVGAAFLLGDGLRTAQASAAILGLDDGSKLHVRQNTTIRFSSQRPTDKKQAFDVEAGQVLVEAGASEVSLVTRLGIARVQAKGKLLIQRLADGLHYDVTVGRALFESSAGQQAIEAGQSYFVSVGAATLESANADAGHAPATGTPATVDAGNAAPQDLDGDVPVQVSGKGVSQRLRDERRFEPVPPGAALLQHGATIRVQAGSSVEIRQHGTTLLLSGPSSYNLGTRERPVELRSGKLSVTGASRIVVPGGIIETAQGTAAALETLGSRRTRVRVSMGSATVSNEKGSTKISAGEEATLSADGSTRLEGRGLEYSDISAEAGESFFVHDPRPPTAIRLQFGGRCPSGGVVRVHSGSGGQFANGENSASLAFGAGRHSYTLHCLGDQIDREATVARGTITVLHDAGTRPVPNTPPATSINIDGRGYNVMYQNQLPRLVVTWPHAPAASGYALHVESRSGSKTYASGSASYTFESGALPEGRHTLYFEGGGRISRRTGVEITFDNAAPMASLATPVQPEVSEGGEINVAGVAQPGWSVEIEGTKVEQDGQRRFKQGVRMPTSQRALAVKLTHPSRGTHVYLRRAARAP